jgi:thymidylate kinase
MPLTASLGAPPRPAPAPPTWPTTLEPAPPLALLARLGAELEARALTCCQWKGHRSRRWATGEGDLDLLVSRVAASTLAVVLARLGFKPRAATPGQEATGVVSFLGHDAASGRLVHVHVHHDVVVGPSWRTHYRLPLARAVLDGATRQVPLPFPVPAPELDLVLTVVGLMLRFTPLDLLRRGEPTWLRRRRWALDQAEAEVSQPAVTRALAAHLPEVGGALFAACRDALRPGRPAWRRLLLRARLAWRLRAHAHRPPLAATVEVVLRGLFGRIGLRGFDTSHLVSGGAVVALVGGDGAGKSTCAAALAEWLAPQLAVRHLHLGRPPRSPVTLAIGAALKTARAVERLARRAAVVSAHLELGRAVCDGWDRYRAYRKARKAAAAGAVVICERHPIPENRLLVGPSRAQGVALGATGRLADRLRQLEESWYARMARPDLVFVLRLHPDQAVRRKPQEPAEYVRRRATFIWESRWNDSGAHLFDAGRPFPEVCAALKETLWASL